MKRVFLLIIISSLFFLTYVPIGISATYYVKWHGDGRTEIDGDTFCGGTCKPGDIIVLPPGNTNDGLYINDLRGEAKNPIIVRNTPGKQTIINTKDLTTTPVYGIGIWVQDSQFIKIDGSNGYVESNDANLTYGIRVTNCAYKGIFLNNNTDQVEIQYIQIDNIGALGYGKAGIGIQEANSISDSNMNEGDTLSGLYIHHNYIFEVTTEGMYLGNTGRCQTSSSCDSKDDDDDAVAWSDVKIYKNRTDNTGWDGISSGCSETTLIYDNHITDAGIDDFTGIGQGLGLALNKGFGGKVYNNTIIGTQKQGIVWQGNGDTDIFNNVIVDVGKMEKAPAYERVGLGAYGNKKAYLKIRYNTIINVAYEAISLSAYQEGLIQDNLFVNIGAYNNYANAKAVNPGVIKSSIQECFFEDAANHNYDLTTSTPTDIRNAGQTTGYPDTDIEGISRSLEPIDIGAYSGAMLDDNKYFGMIVYSPKNFKISIEN